MEEETVVFKLDVSDKQNRQMAMRAIWEFSGVTCVEDMKKGKIKVTGKFEEFEMVMILKKIDSSADISTLKPHNSFTSSLSNFLKSPEKQEIVVFKFRILDERIKQKAMAIIWEFSGVTWVKVKREDSQVEVKGNFEKYEIAMRLKEEIDDSVKITEVRPDVEPEKEAKQGPYNVSGSDAKRSSSFNYGGTSTKGSESKDKQKKYDRFFKENKQAIDYFGKDKGKVYGQIFGVDGQWHEEHFGKQQGIKQDPAVARERQKILKEKAENRRIKKENEAEKLRLALEKAKLEKQAQPKRGFGANQPAQFSQNAKRYPLVNHDDAIDGNYNPYAHMSRWNTGGENTQGSSSFSTRLSSSSSMKNLSRLSQSSSSGYPSGFSRSSSMDNLSQSSKRKEGEKTQSWSGFSSMYSSSSSQFIPSSGSGINPYASLSTRGSDQISTVSQKWKNSKSDNKK